MHRLKKKKKAVLPSHSHLGTYCPVAELPLRRKKSLVAGGAGEDTDDAEKRSSLCLIHKLSP